MSDETFWTRFKQGIARDLQRGVHRLGHARPRVPDSMRSREERRINAWYWGIGTLGIVVVLLPLFSVVEESQSPWLGMTIEMAGALVGSGVGAFLGLSAAIQVDRRRAIENAAADYIATVRAVVQTLAQLHIISIRTAESTGLDQRGELLRAISPLSSELVRARTRAEVALANPDDPLHKAIDILHRFVNTEVMTLGNPNTIMQMYDEKLSPALNELQQVLLERRRIRAYEVQMPALNELQQVLLEQRRVRAYGVQTQPRDS